VHKTRLTHQYLREFEKSNALCELYRNETFLNVELFILLMKWMLLLVVSFLSAC